MSEEQQDDIVEIVAKILPLVKILVGGGVGIGAALLSVGVWVWTQQALNADQEAEIRDIKPRVIAMENRAMRIDASPPVSREQFYELDRRLDRIEQQNVTRLEQNALILDTLKKIESRP